MRQIHSDEDGSFYDLNKFYHKHKVEKAKDQTLIFGDIHEMFLSSVVREKGIFGKKSLIDLVKPTNIVLHDIYDAYTISHHHQNDIFRKYQISKTNKTMVDEIEKC